MQSLADEVGSIWWKSWWNKWTAGRRWTGRSQSGMATTSWCGSTRRETRCETFSHMIFLNGWKLFGKISEFLKRALQWLISVDDRLSPRLMVNLHAGDNPRQPGRVDWAEADARWWRWNPNIHCKPTLTVDRVQILLLERFRTTQCWGTSPHKEHSSTCSSLQPATVWLINIKHSCVGIPLIPNLPALHVV